MRYCCCCRATYTQIVGEYLGAVLEDDSYDLDYKLDFVQSYVQDLTDQVALSWMNDL